MKPVMERWAEFERPCSRWRRQQICFVREIQLETGRRKLLRKLSPAMGSPGLNSYSRLEDHYNIEEYGAYSVRAHWFIANSKAPMARNLRILRVGRKMGYGGRIYIRLS